MLRGAHHLAEGQLEPWLRDHSTVTPLQLLATARWWMVLWIALLTTACYFPLRRLFGAQVAALAVLLMAWDPSAATLSRLLHLDGLLASLSVLALLCFLTWLHGGQRLGYFIVGPRDRPGSAYQDPRGYLDTHRRTIGPRGMVSPACGQGKANRSVFCSPFVAWMAFVAVTVVGLWPAMWVDPLNVLASMAAGLHVHAEGHDSLNFFLGRTTEDPGLLFYPVAYLFRSTPAALHRFGCGCHAGMAAPMAAGQSHQAAVHAGPPGLFTSLCRRHDGGRQEVRPLHLACLPDPGHRGRIGFGGPGAGSVGVVEPATCPVGACWSHSDRDQPRHWFTVWSCWV